MDCLNIPEIDNATWWEQFYKPIGDARFPLSGSIDLTSRCNLNCVHCYINQPPGSLEAIAAEMTTSQVVAILDQIAAAGTLFLLITGGEPLLRPDFSEIYQYARKKGLIITLFTNATMMTPKIIDMLLDAPPSQIEVTMYGGTEETYEAVTRIPGSFRRFTAGLDLIASSGIKFVLKSVVISLNKHDLQNMVALADSYGVELHYDGTIWPRLDGNNDNFNYRLSIDDMLKLNHRDPKRMEGWIQTFENTNGLTLRDERIYHCGAGFRSFHIDSTGRINLCMMARQTSYDVLTTGFDAAWKKLGLEPKRLRTQPSSCLTCTASGLCAQCPGFSQLVYGDNESIVDYVCQLAKNTEYDIINIMNVSKEIHSHE